MQQFVNLQRPADTCKWQTPAYVSTNSFAPATAMRLSEEASVSCESSPHLVTVQS